MGEHLMVNNKLAYSGHQTLPITPDGIPSGAPAVRLKNFRVFDHALINCGIPEDLYDQIFRLFRAYEQGDMYFSTTQSTLSERFWRKVDMA